MCVFSFMGFLRYSEVSNLRMSDIVIHDSYMAIFINIVKRKKVKRTFTEIEIGFTQQNQNSNQRKREKDVHICYTTAIENVLDALNKIDLNSKKFGLHSLRSGGATTASNLGVSNRLFQKHGRWKSERVKNRYVHENIPVLLQVTKNLGLQPLLLSTHKTEHDATT